MLNIVQGGNELEMFWYFLGMTQVLRTFYKLFSDPFSTKQTYWPINC